MNALKVIAFTLAIVTLAACSTPKVVDQGESKSFDYKAPPVKAPSLEVPPELTSFSGDDRYGIPGEADSGTRYSEFTKGGVNRKASSVLPPVKNVRMERKDTQRWLVVNDTAENVWPVVKAFWQENGLTIKIENSQAGIIETEWVENRVKVPTNAFRRYMIGIFDGIISSSERDQFHTRLERSKDGKSTEIYIVHYGLREAAEKDASGYLWLSRPNDPELEATMLQLLMSKLGGGSGVLDSTIKSNVAPVAEVVSAAKLNKLADGTQSILLSEPFDKSWRKVGLALEQAGLALADKDRSKGVYFLSTGKDGSKNKPGTDKAIGMQITVREVSSGCEVSVNNGAGESNAETQKIVDTLYKKLGQI